MVYALPKQTFIRTGQLRSAIFTPKMTALNTKHCESASKTPSFFFIFLFFLGLHLIYCFIITFIKVFKMIPVVKIN